MKFEAVIGLEVHVQLNTSTKIFCSCSTDYSGAEPNTHVCEICSGQPGVLPVLNKEVLGRAVKTGLAFNCQISRRTKFDRKNYFYPDLPKGYQVSQFDMPICVNGHIIIPIIAEDKSIGEKKIGITRIHMEEDAGKNVHGGAGQSFVDLNRAGVPLLEIVSEPDMRSAQEAKDYLEKLKLVLKYVDVSDCNMEDGSLRCDANVSIRPVGETKLGTKTEIKNMNSFRGVQKAIEYEIVRQIEIVTRGEKIVQETRLFDDAKGITLSMRKKEEAFDYRYFPEPDLPPYDVSEDMINDISSKLPEMPDAKFKKYTEIFGLSEYDARLISSSLSMTVFFEKCAGMYNNYKLISNWLMGDITKKMNESLGCDISKIKIKPEHLAEMLNLIDAGTISGKIAKTVIDEMFDTGETPGQIISRLGLIQVSDESFILKVITETLAENQKSIDDYIAGKTAAKGFLVGQIMKRTKGKANPKLVNEMLEAELKKINKL
ncbi:MAG TPA: Asp-tRNA(Asn)/Glu-tRNA(Gln) amidotransferase subunit GatB [Candidatus Wallbacteria bacterium]|nr:Asp-tRNA(Asn)/Glu-tRNA(Gln) amidotransferase subunit GatB [Candidatus Wallbacteria bacterium]